MYSLFWFCLYKKLILKKMPLSMDFINLANCIAVSNINISKYVELRAL